jgi:hypothetical protein
MVATCERSRDNRVLCVSSMGNDDCAFSLRAPMPRATPPKRTLLVDKRARAVCV